jgi:uncharacterized membrane protein
MASARSRRGHHRAAKSSRPERDVETISTLEKAFRRERTIGERLAEVSIRGAGSLPFVGAHVLWFAAWLGVNLNLVPGVSAFDPFPFPFLTLVVSLEAIFLALLVLISQNRLSREADRRALLDFQINLLAERESTKSLAILRRIARRLGVDDKDKEAEHLAASTNVAELAEALKEGS